MGAFIGVILTAIAVLLLLILAEAAEIAKALKDLKPGLLAEHGTPRLEQILSAIEKDVEDRKVRQKRRDADEKVRARKKRYDRSEQIGHVLMGTMQKDSFFREVEMSQDKGAATQHGVFSIMIRKDRTFLTVNIYPELPLPIHVGGPLGSTMQAQEFSSEDIVRAVIAIRNELMKKVRG